MNSILFHFRKLDWPLIVSTLLLVSFGLLSLYSSSLGKKDFLNFKKQTIFLIIAFFLMIIFSFLDWRVFREDSY
jgi:cell division protein FtsW (lipid II flippase)